MSPEIRVNKDLIASVPDETGWYQTISGKPLHIDVDGIDANSKGKQKIIIRADEVGGMRVLGLTAEGIGNSSDPKRGDQKLPEVKVTLLDKPIRITYRRSEWHDSRSLAETRGEYSRKYKVTYKNPRWTRGHGQR